MRPHGLYSPCNSPGQNTRVGSLYLLPGSSEPRSPALQAGSLPAEPQGKPKNTGVGSLSLLQWIFPTQELNQDLLRCRWILYQLSHQGSPFASLSLQILNMAFLSGLLSHPRDGSHSAFSSLYGLVISEGPVPEPVIQSGRFTRACVYEGSQLGSAKCG